MFFALVPATVMVSRIRDGRLRHQGDGCRLPMEQTTPTTCVHRGGPRGGGPDVQISRAAAGR